MIPDLIDRYKKLVDLSLNPHIYPPPDIYRELAQEWFSAPVVTDAQIAYIMKELKKQLDKMAMFEAMHEKYR